MEYARGYTDSECGCKDIVLCFSHLLISRLVAKERWMGSKDEQKQGTCGKVEKLKEWGWSKWGIEIKVLGD